MRSNIQERVRRIEKIIAEQAERLVVPVAILTPVDGGYVDANGKKYKKLEDCQATMKIINNIPRMREIDIE